MHEPHRNPHQTRSVCPSFTLYRLNCYYIGCTYIQVSTTIKPFQLDACQQQYIIITIHYSTYSLQQYHNTLTIIEQMYVPAIPIPIPSQPNFLLLYQVILTSLSTSQYLLISLLKTSTESQDFSAYIDTSRTECIEINVQIKLGEEGSQPM